MAIKDRNLNVGTKLTGKYHKQPYTCEVIEGESGKVKYRLEDGREFKSWSAAGMAITGHQCDGWMFWSVEEPATPTTAEPVEIQQPEQPKMKQLQNVLVEKEAAPPAKKPTARNKARKAS